MLIRLFWVPGTRDPADLSSKYHNNLAAVVNSSYYREGHASYGSKFPCNESVLFATMLGGVFKFRGLTSLAKHTSHCYYCCANYGREVAGILVYHTEILAGTGRPVATDSPSDGYENIVTADNTARDAAIVARGSTGITYTQQFYEELLARLIP